MPEADDGVCVCLGLYELLCVCVCMGVCVEKSVCMCACVRVWLCEHVLWSLREEGRTCWYLQHIEICRLARVRFCLSSVLAHTAHSQIRTNAQRR